MRWMSLSEELASARHLLAEEPDEHWHRFGVWLNRARIAAKMQKGELAKAAGISDTQLRHYLKGWRVAEGQRVLPNPDELTLHRLAAALDVDPREVCARAARDCSLPTVAEGEDDLELLAQLRHDLNREYFEVTERGSNPREYRMLEAAVKQLEDKLKAEGRYRDVYLGPDGLVYDDEPQVASQAAATSRTSDLTPLAPEAVSRTAHTDVPINLLNNVYAEQKTTNQLLRQLIKRLGGADDQPVEDAEGDT